MKGSMQATKPVCVSAGKRLMEGLGVWRTFGRSSPKVLPRTGVRKGWWFA